jgi:hypothetical protein
LFIPKQFSSLPVDNPSAADDESDAPEKRVTILLLFRISNPLLIRRLLLRIGDHRMDSHNRWCINPLKFFTFHGRSV